MRRSASLRTSVLGGGFAAALLGAPAAALSYSAVEFDNGACRPHCPSVIVATGLIVADEADALQGFIREAGPDRRWSKVLVIHSSGGNALGGLKLGSYLRQNGVTVIVASVPGNVIAARNGLGQGFCGPACAFALAGGEKRIVPPGSRVAVLGAAGVGDGSEGADRTGLAEAFASYYKYMGVDPELVAIDQDFPRAGPRTLTEAELVRFRLAQPGF